MFDEQLEMNSNTLCVAFTVLCTALIVSHLFSLNPVENRFNLLSRESPDQSIAVLYCARDIPAHKVITSDDLLLKMIPQSRAISNACSSKWIAIGREVAIPLRKGECISLAEFGLVKSPNTEGSVLSEFSPANHFRVIHGSVDFEK